MKSPSRLSAWLAPRLAPRLALRVYLVGLVQTAVIAAGFVTLMEANRPRGPGPARDHARFVAATIAGASTSDEELARALARAKELSRASAWVLDPSGAVLATNDPDGRRCSAPPEDGARPMPCESLAMVLPSGLPGVVEVRAPGGLPTPSPWLGVRILALVLFVVGVSSWMLGRSLTRPLRRLSDAARAFGGGDLRARAGLERSDELGQVARAFDEMAERVTDLLRAEKELLANVSHELRTPLARIRVALDLAAEGDGELQKESLAEIAIDLAELERLIADVLTAARLELVDGPSSSGAPPLRKERLRAGRILDQSVARFRAAHPKRTLEVDTWDQLPDLEVDAVLMRRAVDNLLENAQKYSPDPETSIELRAGVEGREVWIEVRDRGIGIAESDLPHVFRPFFRADRSRTRATGGLGLGLALTKRIVEAHEGTISVETKVDEGTRVRLRVPIAGE